MMRPRAVAYATIPDTHLVDNTGDRIPIRPTLQRLLGVLLRHPDGVDDNDLIAMVWAEHPPADPPATLRTAISRLHNHLPAHTLTRTGGRYRLHGLPGGGRVPVPLVGRDVDLHTIGTLLRTHGGVLVTGSAGLGRTRVLAEFAARRTGPVHLIGPVNSALHLRSLHHALGAERHTATIIVDDLHHADTTTCAFIAAVGELYAPAFVASARTGADLPWACGLPLLTRSWAQHRIGPLGDDAARLLGRSAGLPDTPRAAALIAAAAGNPELICALAHDRTSGAVADRLTDLPGTCADTLDLLAQAGHLDWAAAETLNLLEDLHTLEDEDLVAATGDGVRPRSALVADTVNERRTGARRRQHARRLRTAVADPVARVRWALEIGENPPVDELVAASDHALRAGDTDTARRFAETAWRAAPGPDTAFGWLHAMLLGTQSGAEVAHSIDHIGQTLGGFGPQLAAPAALITLIKDADPDAATARLDRITDRTHPLVVVAGALLRTYTGNPDTTTPLKIITGTGDPAVRGAAWSAAFLAADLTADTATLALLPPIADAATHGLSPTQLHAMRCRTNIHVLDLTTADLHATAAEATVTLGDLRMRAWLATLRSEIAFWSGDFEKAAGSARTAAELLRRSHHRSDERIARQWLALTCACAGHSDWAATALKDAAALPGAAVTGEHHTHLAAAVLAARRGRSGRTDIDRARRTMRENNIDAEQLASALDAALAAGTSVPRGPAAPMVTALRRSLGRADVLTPREAEVMALYTRRWTAREVADELGLSVTTVRNHVARAYRKLGIHGRPATARPEPGPGYSGPERVQYTGNDAST
ncbi:hypothetical protein GII33_16605 [Gordonia pseudamarae]|uniref:HTH luxR-type domain-containing protein n=1 Tax=Gordonia pseudamarae TaxID=2831662 RepID=A0ABX6IKN1_9ACTN|nr:MULTISPECIES: LuxR C-terminal-related transcriptional regulator [Gordonia]QHN27328.1 hypothetical protein GII33_16605 [Gordonia pseudamarae]QHN36211.1 hypothetical protein GII31_16380 [Gordonia pseudamarae]